MSCRCTAGFVMIAASSATTPCATKFDSGYVTTSRRSTGTKELKSGCGIRERANKPAYPSNSFPVSHQALPHSSRAATGTSARRRTLRPSPNWQYLRPSRKIRRKSPARDRRSRKRPISAPAHPAGRGNGQSRNRGARLARQHGSSAGSHRNLVHTLSPDTASYRPPRRSAPGENAPAGQPSATYSP